MSTVALSSLPPRATYTDEPIFRLTVDQYHELIRSGKLTEDDPVELVEGIPLFKTPKNTPHATATRLCRRAIEPLLPVGWFYDSQEPVTLSDGEPEPDGIVIRGRIEDYAAAHPIATDVALLIEVADSTLDRDRGIKLRSYARAGIPHYWIVNLIDRQVEVFASPDPAGSLTPTYRQRDVLSIGGQLSLTLPDVSLLTVPVASILPPGQ